MGKGSISQFREIPKTKVGLWSMWLGLSPFLIMLFLGFFAAVIRPIIDRLSSENIGATFGLGIGAFYLILTLAALATAIIALKKGERSWGIWLGFLPSTIWIFFIIGELVFPH